MVTRGKSDSRPPAPISDTQAAYLAGLMDGEGFISIILIRKSKTAAGSIPFYFRPTVSIASTTECLAQPFAEAFGGSLTFRTPIGRKSVWDWRVFDRRAEHLCRTLVPYLTLKRPLAEKILSFYDDYPVSAPDARGLRAKEGHRIPFVEVERRVRLMREMLELRGSGRELNEGRINELLDAYRRRPQRLSEGAPDPIG